MLLQSARRGQDWVLVQNDKTFARFLGQLLQALTQFPIFTGKGFEAETAEFSERCRFDENKRSMKQPPPAESKIQDGHHQLDVETLLIPAKGRAAAATGAGLNLLCRVGKQFHAGMGIGVHKNQPVAGGRRRPGIPGAGDLIDWFKYNRRAGSSRDFRRAVGGIVVAHDQFDLPAALRECARRRFDRGPAR